MATQKVKKKTSKACFVIAPIGKEGSETKKRSKLIFRYIVTPAVKKCGYKPINADKISEPGIITTQIIQHIAEDQMMIADLSERNANVFYELALRHVLRKPVIQMIGKGEKIPFNIAATRIVVLDHKDLDSVEEAKQEIIKQIKAAEAPEFELETPIHVAIELLSKKEISGKWLPAAEVACVELIRMSSDAKKMIESHREACEKMQKGFPSLEKEQREKIKSIIDMKCDTCADKMSNLKKGIDNAVSHWENFINDACEPPECTKFHKRLDEKRKELGV